MTPKLLVSLVVLLTLSNLTEPVEAEPQQTHTQAAVFWSTPDERDAILQITDLDIMKIRPGHSFTIVTNEQQLTEINALGFRTEVLIEDMAAFYSLRRGKDNNFGDFHTYSEATAYLDSIHTEYPDITTAKFSIGQTEEGRTMWGIKVSDNPDVNEDEPEVLLDALHHAREPITVEVILDFLRYLCDGYGSDPVATYLVDEREIWLIPVVNPDGYCYNESEDPGGGGMWRKNRRDNGNGCYGVDLNRNYPYEWGGEGASPDPCDYLYWGPSAGSEPETQAIMSLFAGHEFVTHNSYHSVVGVILIPWSYTNDDTPDHAVLMSMAEHMAEMGYGYGQADEIGLYLCSGTTLDWSYGEQTPPKTKTLAFTTEVGGSGFWPLDEEIPGLVAENLPANIYLAQSAAGYIDMDTYVITDGRGDGKLDPGETAELTVTLDNLGATEGVSDVDLILRSRDPYISLSDAFHSYGSFAILEGKDNSIDPFNLSVDVDCPQGHLTTLLFDIYAGGSLFMRQPVQATIGSMQVVFSDDFESGTGNWSFSGGSWALVTSPNHSPSHSITDSPSGDYSNSENTYMYLTTGLDLSTCTDAEISFWHRYEIESGYDYAYVEASAGGGTFMPLGIRFTGFQTTWTEETRSLIDYCGSSDVKIRFRLQSDTYVTEDGWFIDDIQVVVASNSNTPPGVPELALPSEGETLGTANPNLVALNAADPDPGSTLTYGFQVFSDSLLTNLVASTSGVTEGTDSTSWIVDTVLEDGTYWWRAWADDGTEAGLCPEPGTFVVEASSDFSDRPDPSEQIRTSLGAEPNPFSDGTLIAFSVPGRSYVEISVFDVSGRKVTSLASQVYEGGTHRVRWDGRDRAGQLVAGGVYFCHVQAEGRQRSIKLMVVR